MKSRLWHKNQISIWITPQEVMFQQSEHNGLLGNKNFLFKHVFQRALTNSIIVQMVQILYQTEAYQVWITT